MNKQPPEVTPEMLQQHPELMMALLFVLALMTVYFFGALASWSYFGYRFYQGQPLLSVDPWRPRAWGFVDLLLVGGAAVVCQTLVVLVGSLAMGDDPRTLATEAGGVPLKLAFLSGLGNVLAMLVIVVWVCLRFGVGPRHVGFTLARLPKHLGQGLLVGLAMLPVVYVLMFVVSIGLKTDYAHPLLDQITKDRSLTAYLLGVAAAAVFAPLAEEFLFRVVLQGWLQSLPFKSLAANVIGMLPTWMRPAQVESRPGTDRIAAGSEAGNPGGELLEQGTAPNEYRDVQSGSDTSVSEASSVEVANPYAPSSSPSLGSGLGYESSSGYASGLGYAESGQANVVPPIWPSVVTGILFGLAHWGYGLSFIPLIVMGIVLGLVYRATHSIWPCVLIHFMLNSTSMIFLGVLILQQNVAAA